MLSPSHPHLSVSLNNLVVFLQTQSELSGRGEDVEEAIVLRRQPLELRLASRPQQSLSLDDLTNSL